MAMLLSPDELRELAAWMNQLNAKEREISVAGEDNRKNGPHKKIQGRSAWPQASSWCRTILTRLCRKNFFSFLRASERT